MRAYVSQDIGIMYRLSAALGVFAMLVATQGVAHGQSWKPDRPVEIVVGVGPGGSVDITARLIQKIWQDQRMVDVPTAVVNKTGGGGAIAFSYLDQHRTDGHYIMLTAIPFLTNHITGRSPIHYSDFTPITRLSADYVLFTVRGDSPIKTGAELLQRWREDPSSISTAVGISLGTANHIAAGLAIKATGADAKKGKYVVFKSSAESFTALLGGHVDIVAASPASSIGQLVAKRVRPLAINAPQRLAGPLAAVPTLKELGLDAVFSNWRIVIAPKDLSETKVNYWHSAFIRLASTEEWKQALEKNYYDGTISSPKETRQFLDTQYGQLKSILTDLGMTR